MTSYIFNQLSEILNMPISGYDKAVLTFTYMFLMYKYSDSNSVPEEAEVALKPGHVSLCLT